VWSCGLALLHADIDRPAEAAQDLEAAMASDPSTWQHDGNWLPCVAMLAEVCAAVGDRARAARLHQLLVPFAGTQVVLFDGIALLGPVDYFLGLLGLTAGDVAGGVRDLEAALEQCRRLGTTALAERVLEALERGRAGGAAPAPRTSGAEARVLRREGAYWTVAFGGVASRLRHSRGLSYLAYLLRHPGEEFHALELAAAMSESGDAVEPRRRAAARELGRGGLGGSGGELLDARAKA
jgi:hypothetical protein